MSMHKSLKRDKWAEKRNVRKRFERLEKLVKSLKWAKGASVFGLPREKVERIKIKIKEEKDKVKKDDLLVTLEPTKLKQKKKSKDVVGIR